MKMLWSSCRSQGEDNRSWVHYMAADFFTKVMALPPRIRPAPPPTKKKKPGVRGRAAKAKRASAGRKKKPFDIFKVVLAADAGRDSQKEKESFFDLHLKELSESELDKLKKKINRIRKNTLDGSQEHHVASRVDSFLQDAVNRRLQRSGKAITSLQMKVRKKLKKVKNIQGIVTNGTIRSVFDGVEKRSLDRFVEEFFQEEIVLYESKLAAHEIIPGRRKMTGKGFVRREVRFLLENH